jgi:hypothetical protein
MAGTAEIWIHPNTQKIKNYLVDFNNTVIYNLKKDKISLNSSMLWH